MPEQDNEKQKKTYIASAIISIPFRFDNRTTRANFEKSNIWKAVPSFKSVENLGLLPHVKDLFSKNNHNLFAGNDIEIFTLKNTPVKLTKIFNGSTIIFESLHHVDPKYDFSFKLKFLLEDPSNSSDKDSELFWDSPKLIIYSLSNLGILTIPVYHYNVDKGMDDIYTFFNKISVSLKYGWEFNNKISMKSIFKALTEPFNKVESLCNKSLISFIYAYNPDLNEKGEGDFKQCAEKLAYTDQREGFIIDDKETVFIQLLDSQKLYTSSGPFGASFVTDNRVAFKPQNQDKYYWIYMFLLVQRYSLFNMLYDLNRIFGDIANNLIKGKNKLLQIQEKYQTMCEIKAGLYYSEISDQYHNLRLYHIFFDGLNIRPLYNEVEEKLEALDKYVTIENDKKREFRQAMLTALVLILTVTSALNDFFDIVEDSTKIVPGLIALVAVIVIVVIFWEPIKSISGR